jgi:glycopeptide antibiotics resistance protein
MTLRIPVIVLALAFTAVPMEVRPLSEGIADVFNMSLDVPDVIANIAGYIPIGIVLATRSAWPAIGVATAVSGLAEASQVVTTGRSPSIIDLFTNVVGA